MTTYTTFKYGDPTISTSPIGKRFGVLAPKFVATILIALVDQVIQSGVVGSAYSTTVQASGGAGAYTYAVTSGSLPTSLSLNSSTGVISGTPSAAATFTFTIRATDANGNTGTQSFQIIVIAAASGGASNSGYAA